MMKVLLFSIVDIICFYFVIVFYPQATDESYVSIALPVVVSGNVEYVHNRFGQPRAMAYHFTAVLHPGSHHGKYALYLVERLVRIAERIGS